MEREIIKRSLLSDAVIEAMHKQILHGKIKPGDRLPSEKEMCKLFSVGRSTLREAIKALTVINVLDKKKNGTFVSKMPDLTFKMDGNFKLFLKQESYRELLEIRKIMEVKISGLSAMRANAQDLSLMKSIVQSMERNLENNCYREYIQDDLNFHQAIAASTKNQFLLNQIITIREMLTDLYEKLVTSSVFPRCHKHHCLILEAICRRDVAAVEELMLAHLNEVELTINEQIKRYLEKKA